MYWNCKNIRRNELWWWNRSHQECGSSLHQRSIPRLEPENETQWSIVFSFLFLLSSKKSSKNDRYNFWRSLFTIFTCRFITYLTWLRKGALRSTPVTAPAISERPSTVPRPASCIRAWSSIVNNEKTRSCWSNLFVSSFWFKEVSNGQKSIYKFSDLLLTCPDSVVPSWAIAG